MRHAAAILTVAGVVGLVSAQPGPTTRIAFLLPTWVKIGWEGVVEIHGENFDSGSFVFFDSEMPKTTFKNSNLLEVLVKKNLTNSPGTKKVKVHTAGGDLSNEVDFVVERK